MRNKVNRLADDILEFSDGSITRENAVAEAAAYIRRTRWQLPSLGIHGPSQKMIGKAIAYKIMDKPFYD